MKNAAPVHRGGVLFVGRCAGALRQALTSIAAWGSILLPSTHANRGVPPQLTGAANGNTELFGLTQVGHTDLQCELRNQLRLGVGVCPLRLVRLSPLLHSKRAMHLREGLR